MHKLILIREKLKFSYLYTKAPPTYLLSKTMSKQKQEQDQLKKETKAMANPQLQQWKKEKANIALMVEASYLTLAGKLNEKNMIDFDLYDRIVCIESGTPENQRARLMFLFITRKLRTGKKSKVDSIWKALISILKKESLWRDTAEEMGKVKRKK